MKQYSRSRSWIDEIILYFLEAGLMKEILAV